MAAKWNASWIHERDAVAVSLELERLTTPMAQVLARLPPAMLETATVATLALEILGPAVVWLPVATAKLRMAAVAAFVAFHLVALAPVLRLGLFPWVCALAWTVFLPPAFWDGLRTRFASRTSQGSVEIGLPRRIVGERRWVDGGAAIALVLVILGWWGQHLPGLAPRIPDAVLQTTRTLGLHQRWQMFAESPRTDGWYLMVGTLADGREVDLWHGGTVDGSRPAVISATYRNVFWGKYLELILASRNVHHRRLFGDYLCHRWNTSHEGIERLERLYLVFMLEEIVAPGERRPTEALVLWAQSCTDR